MEFAAILLARDPARGILLDPHILRCGCVSNLPHPSRSIVGVEHSSHGTAGRRTSKYFWFGHARLNSPANSYATAKGFASGYEPFLVNGSDCREVRDRNALPMGAATCKLSSFSSVVRETSNWDNPKTCRNQIIQSLHHALPS